MDSVLVIYLVAILAAVACGLAGIFLVLRRLAMLADAITHSVLPGLVAAYFFAQGPNYLAGLLGAVTAGLATSVLVQILLRSGRVRQDAAIGLVFPAMFALGVFWVSRSFENVHLDADAILYGEIAYAPFDTLLVGGQNLGPVSLWLLGGLTLLNVGVLYVFYKEFKVATFDAALAAALGLLPGVMHYLLMSLVAATTVGALGAVGAILALGLIVIPPVIASLWTQRLPALIAITLIVAAGGASLGVAIAFWMDVSISGMVASVLGVLCALSVLAAPEQGIVSRLARRRTQRAEFTLVTLLVHLETHRGTEREAEESRMEHLTRELGWRPHMAEGIVAGAVRRGWIELHGDRLSLTEAGRARLKAHPRLRFAES